VDRMKIELKDFQEDAVAKLISHFDSARYEVAKGEAQAISLASPTGSGKTVIATAAIERILEGDDDHSADPDAIFLWITDQPELNAQTKNKMLATSSVLTPAHLVVVDAALNQEVLTPGHVYFLNTQKLGQNSLLIREGNGRDFTLWQTIANTIEACPTSFYVIVDEAHRGMQERRDREEANTIIQKFIKGSSDEIPPVPLVFAISATIARFNEVVAKTQRVKRELEVPIEAVRASGLLKDAINLFHPDEKQSGDITMLREAARSWRVYLERWASYGKEEKEDLIRPVLVVQVEDASGKEISKTDLGTVLRALSDELDSPPAEAFAHAFQEGGPISVDSRTVRYLQPSAIDSDPDVQVVFFKTSLNTGWDCPRAEVMMSFRKAKDDTHIAQLVGRMVRAPLARPIQTDEHLNTVALYLPHYDQKGLARVIDRLQAGDPANMPPTEIREGREAAVLARAKDSAQVFDLLSSLPSYVIPRSKVSSQVRRLGKMATLLNRYGIADRAPDAKTEFLVGILQEEREARKGSKGFTNIVKDSGVLDVRMVEWSYDPDTLPEKTIQIPISDENVNDLFDWSGRRLGEGLHKAYWKARAAGGAKNHRTTKLEAYALASTPGVVDRLQREAQRRVQELLKKHDAAIKRLPDGGQQAFNEIRGLALEPELTSPVYPEAPEVPRGEDAYDRHLYVDDKGGFSFKTTSWERATLEEELKRDDLVVWLRNPDRKPWSLCVPYEMGRAVKGCYPDFIIIRKQDGQLLADIVDPHLLSFEDAWHRAKGLARYAAKHADKFGRIEMIRVEDGRVDRIDLVDEKWRERVLDVSSNPHLRELFDS
jgi:type III restriction enzyme